MITQQKLELIKTVLEYHFTDEQWSEFFSKAAELIFNENTKGGNN